MTKIYATPRKMLSLDVVGQSVVVRTAHSTRTRTFKNRYTLRKFVSTQVALAKAAGAVSVK